MRKDSRNIQEEVSEDIAYIAKYEFDEIIRYKIIATYINLIWLF